MNKSSRIFRSKILKLLISAQFIAFIKMTFVVTNFIQLFEAYFRSVIAQYADSNAGTHENCIAKTFPV